MKVLFEEGYPYTRLPFSSRTAGRPDILGYIAMETVFVHKITPV